MDELKVCFVGVGSIAKRHIRNLKSICINRDIKLHIDAFRRSGETIEGVNNVFTDIYEVPKDYDAIFITNPTEYHLDSLIKFHDKGRNFFVEKPVVSVNQIQDALNFKRREDSIYYVACPLRYNAVIQYIRKNVDLRDIISVRSISSSYLPDWRPDQDYRHTYSAHKDMGGGVGIDLIHEWDYLTYLIGWPKYVKHMSGKKSQLEIDSDDYAVYIAEYDDKIVELHLDYFGRKTIREIQLFTKADTVLGDIANNNMRFMVSGDYIDFKEGRDDYQKRELNHFIDMVFGITEPEDGFMHGIKVLQLTQGDI